ncbi:MAG: glycoside hydrolase family 3 protein [Nocardioides sp.]
MAAAVALPLLSSCSPAGDPEASGAALMAAEVLRDESKPRAWGVAAHAGDSASTEPLPIGAGWGPTEDEIDRARRLVGKLSLRERAGQVIVASYDGTAAPTRLVNRLHLGGVVLFSENVAGTDQVRRSNRALQRAAADAGRRFPVTIGVDQEGGIVERVTTGTRFPTFMTAGAADRPALTRRVSAASGGELAGLGFTTDYAPVADVTVGAADPTIGARSAGSRPELVAEHAVAAAGGYRSTGLVPVLKHFPGHGSVTADSHLTLPVQRKSVQELEHSDFVPFRAGIGAGLPSVMVGHIDVRAVDPGMPATLSRKVVTGLLRERLGFEGLVVTDSLSMRAVTRRYTSGQAAVRSLRAGNDVVLMPVSPRDARDGIVRAVRERRLSSARLVQAATRQVALLLHQQAQGLTRRPPGSSGAVSARWSAAALTSVSGPCSGRLVGRKVKVTGPADAVRTFTAAAAEAGLRVARRGSTVRLVGFQDGPAEGDVVVALDSPHVLGTSRDRTARLATYGQTRGAMRALVAVLLGRAGAPGHLPVPVAGVPRDGC